jgi:hypothetical protein
MKISKRIKSIIGIGAIVLTVAIAILWNTVLRTELTSAQVYVLKSSVVEGDKITQSNIGLIKIARTDMLKGAITSRADASKLTQMEARQFIPAGAQLLTEYFEEPQLVLKDGQYIFPIPNEWIVAFPDTIRRGDTAYFYVYSTEEAQRLMSGTASETGNTIDVTTPAPTVEISTPAPLPTPIPTPVKGKVSALINSTSIPTPSTTSSPEPSSTPASTGAINLSSDELASLIAGKIYQFSAVVAYCKDKSNQEVINNGTDTNDRLQRYSGSSTIASIEIVATEAEIDMLQKAVLQGYRFIISYN